MKTTLAHALSELWRHKLVKTWERTWCALDVNSLELVLTCDVRNQQARKYRRSIAGFNQPICALRQTMGLYAVLYSALCVIHWAVTRLGLTTMSSFGCATLCGGWYMLYLARYLIDIQWPLNQNGMRIPVTWFTWERNILYIIVGPTDFLCQKRIFNSTTKYPFPSVSIAKNFGFKHTERKGYWARCFASSWNCGRTRWVGASICPSKWRALEFSIKDVWGRCICIWQQMRRRKEFSGKFTGLAADFSRCKTASARKSRSQRETLIPRPSVTPIEFKDAPNLLRSR